MSLFYDSIPPVVYQLRGGKAYRIEYDANKRDYYTIGIPKRLVTINSDRRRQELERLRRLNSHVLRQYAKYLNQLPLAEKSAAESIQKYRTTSVKQLKKAKRDLRDDAQYLTGRRRLTREMMLERDQILKDLEERRKATQEMRDEQEKIIKDLEERRKARSAQNAPDQQNAPPKITIRLNPKKKRRNRVLYELRSVNERINPNLNFR